MSSQTSAARGVAWTDANQRVLAAEFARLKAQLAGEDTAPARRALEEARAELPSAAAIDELSAAFGLSAFERDLLLLCAGIEVDGGLAAQCRPFATFALAFAALEGAHWSALTPVGPLRLLRLIEVQEGERLTATRVTINERVLHYLAGLNYLDPCVRPLISHYAAPSQMADGHARTARLLVEALAPGQDAIPVVQLFGDDRCGQRDVASMAAAWLGLKLHVLHEADIPANPHEAEALAWLWQREGTLLRSGLLVDCDVSGGSALARFVQQIGGLVFIGIPQPVPLGRSDLRFPIDRPTIAEQKRLWIQMLGPAAERVNGALDGVAAQFRLSTEQITRIARRLRTTLLTSDAPNELLWRDCRASVGTRIDDLAQRIAPTATWSDLVLPDSQRATLAQIAAHVRQRLKVYEEWGFATKCARGLGISALFSGESGTGKTMAAEVLANELHLDLYRIDLASTVSKYIGETEKNLRRVFDAAEHSGSILLFDEADALFGRRSEVKDSHDRYANIEVSYLLQRIEAYRGLVILTTNAKASIDPAFERRLTFTVVFSFPDVGQREQIWRGIFPGCLPLASIDYPALARLNIPGGAIRNVALGAAFLAAEAGSSVDMKHLMQAARADAAKRERPFTHAETRGWR